MSRSLPLKGWVIPLAGPCARLLATRLCGSCARLLRPDRPGVDPEVIAVSCEDGRAASTRSGLDGFRIRIGPDRERARMAVPTDIGVRMLPTTVTCGLPAEIPTPDPQ